MKKFAIGCLSVFGILFVAGGIILYIFVLRPAQGFISNVQQFEQITELDSKVTNRMSFNAPSNKQLTEVQVSRFMEVQAHMLASFEGRTKELETKFKELEVKLDSQNRDAGIREIVSAWGDISDLALDAKRAQVEALNHEDFSLEEYNWVREQVYLAVGIVGYQLGLTELAKAAQGGEVQLPEELGDVPQENITLLEPYKDQLEQYAAFAVFGL